jgi:hypothetical protein
MFSRNDWRPPRSQAAAEALLLRHLICTDAWQQGAAQGTAALPRFGYRMIGTLAIEFTPCGWHGFL